MKNHAPPQHPRPDFTILDVSTSPALTDASVEKRGAGACGQLWLGLAERKNMGKTDLSAVLLLFAGFAACSTQKEIP